MSLTYVWCLYHYTCILYTLYYRQYICQIMRIRNLKPDLDPNPESGIFSDDLTSYIFFVYICLHMYQIRWFYLRKIQDIFTKINLLKEFLCHIMPGLPVSRPEDGSSVTIRACPIWWASRRSVYGTILGFSQIGVTLPTHLARSANALPPLSQASLGPK